jgi:hypothetical protein
VQGGTVSVLGVDDRRVFAFARSHPEHGSLLGLANLSEDLASVPAAALGWAGVSGAARDVLSGRSVAVDHGRIMVAPLEVLWITDDSVRRIAPAPPVA